jgi:hypothetical protein
MNAYEIPRQARIRHTVFGGMLIVGGLLLWYSGLGLWHVGALWPLVVVGLGTSRLLGACCARQRRDGVWLLTLGLWFALNQFTVLRYHDTWPLLVVAVGGLITWRAIAPLDGCAICKEGHRD